MFDLVRKVVAGPKRTTNYEGRQLDLTYITERVIAMAFPASDMLEKTYRNNIEDISNYLSEYHSQNYLIINVSSRLYNYAIFNNRVKDFEWPDHQAPPLTTLVDVGYSIMNFLRDGKDRVVAVHCNHGKGRTGTAIITFFLLANYFHSTSQCLKFYNLKRFNKDTYGVDQPCQLRYLNYIERLKNENKINKKLICLHLRKITHIGLDQNYFIRIKSTRNQQTIYERINFNEKNKKKSKILLADIFIELFYENWMISKKVARINCNLYFIDNTLQLKFKGKNIKVENQHSKDFQITLHFQYFCLCHLPIYNETICVCNYVRSIEEDQWSRTISAYNTFKSISEEESYSLVHGYKPSSNIEDKEDGQFIQSENFESCNAKKKSPAKQFRNNRQEKIAKKIENNKSKYNENENEDSDKKDEVIEQMECQFNKNEVKQTQLQVVENGLISQKIMS